MSKVVDILSKQPHMTGPAKCLNCGHNWIAVTEIGVIALECPSCHTSKGVFDSLCFPTHYWECECGCCHFAIGPTHATCLLCGIACNFGTS